MLWVLVHTSTESFEMCSKDPPFALMHKPMRVSQWRRECKEERIIRSPRNVLQQHKSANNRRSQSLRVTIFKRGHLFFLIARSEIFGRCHEMCVATCLVVRCREALRTPYPTPVHHTPKSNTQYSAQRKTCVTRIHVCVWCSLVSNFTTRRHQVGVSLCPPPCVAPSATCTRSLTTVCTRCLVRFSLHGRLWSRTCLRDCGTMASKEVTCVLVLFCWFGNTPTGLLRISSCVCVCERCSSSRSLLLVFDFFSCALAPSAGCGRRRRWRHARLSVSDVLRARRAAPGYGGFPSATGRKKKTGTGVVRKTCEGLLLRSVVGL